MADQSIETGQVPETQTGVEAVVIVDSSAVTGHDTQNGDVNPKLNYPDITITSPVPSDRPISPTQSDKPMSPVQSDNNDTHKSQKCDTDNQNAITASNTNETEQTCDKDTNKDMDTSNAQESAPQASNDAPENAENVPQENDNPELIDDELMDTSDNLAASPSKETRKTQSSMSGSKLPSITPAKAFIQRIPSPTPDKKSDVAKMEQNRKSAKLKYPPQIYRMNTMAVTQKARHPATMIPPPARLYAGTPRRPRKVVTWEEAMEARPPLRIDMDGPTPCSYTPKNKPLYETNAPSFSFGRKSFVEKQGGSRTSWEKTWFQSSDVWRQKTDFFSDRQKWPTPAHYEKKAAIGPNQISSSMQTFPAYSVGVRREHSMLKKGVEREPAPNEYDKDRADMVVLKRAPSFTHSLRRGGTCLWSSGSHFTPGPGAYDPEPAKLLKHTPAFTIQGMRRTKTHELGPFATF